MAEKERKRRRIHRVLVILIIILAVALFLELRRERGEWLVKEISVEPQEQRYFVMPSAGKVVGFFEPEIDLSETESEYIVRCDLPGVEKDQIEVSVKGNYLTLSGRRDIKREESKEDVYCYYYYRERRSGDFKRSILLPSLVDEGGVQAEYEDGILVIRLPKLKPAEQRGLKKIQII